jgi:hypothetical protein
MTWRPWSWSDLARPSVLWLHAVRHQVPRGAAGLVGDRFVIPPICLAANVLTLQWVPTFAK